VHYKYRHYIPSLSLLALEKFTNERTRSTVAGLATMSNPIPPKDLKSLDCEETLRWIEQNNVHLSEEVVQAFKGNWSWLQAYSYRKYRV